MADPVVVSARRTATGRFGGALQDVTAAELGGKVLAAALAECQMEASEVDEVLMGMVYQGGGRGQSGTPSDHSGWAAIRGAVDDGQ